MRVEYTSDELKKMRIAKGKCRLVDFLDSREEKRLIHHGEYFHVTKNNLGRFVVLDPKYTIFGVGGREEECESDPYISFGPSVQECISALGDDLMQIGNAIDDDDNWVYTPIRDVVMYVPKHISDYRKTGELRSYEPVECERVGKVTWWMDDKILDNCDSFIDAMWDEETEDRVELKVIPVDDHCRTNRRKEKQKTVKRHIFKKNISG
jgi:hypothetical protein